MTLSVGPPPRLTWQTFLAVLALVLLYAGALAYSVATDPGPVVAASEMPPCGDAVQVEPGDTMWGIAERCFPGQHMGSIVWDIRQLNPDVDPGNMQPWVTWLWLVPEVER